LKKQTTNSVRTENADENQVGEKTQSSPLQPESIEQRARELALINGRDDNHVLESDRDLAEKELLGDAAANDAADESEIMPRGMGSPPTSTGHATEKYLPMDDEVEIRMVQQGVDEATHDQMLAAAKIKTRSKG